MPPPIVLSVPEGPPLADIGAMADWVPRLLEAAGLAEAALVGHSMGALVALDCAARHGEAAAAIALLGAALFTLLAPSAFHRWDSASSMRRSGS